MHTRIGAKPWVELAVADIDCNHATRSGLEKAVGEAASRGADVRAVAPFDLDREGSQRVGELLTATGDERRRSLDPQLNPFVHLLTGLVVPLDEAREDERLSLAPRFREASFDEKDVEPPAGGFQQDLPWELIAPGGEQMPTWLLVLIIVLVVLALFGGFGYTRR